MLFGQNASQRLGVHHDFGKGGSLHKIQIVVQIVKRRGCVFIVTVIVVVITVRTIPRLNGCVGRRRCIPCVLVGIVHVPTIAGKVLQKQVSVHDPKQGCDWHGPFVGKGVLEIVGQG